MLGFLGGPRWVSPAGLSGPLLSPLTRALGAERTPTPATRGTRGRGWANTSRQSPKQDPCIFSTVVQTRKQIF